MLEPEKILILNKTLGWRLFAGSNKVNIMLKSPRALGDIRLSFVIV